MTRQLKIGDMVIYDHKSNLPFTGLVKRIETDRWGHQTNVFIHWQGKPPHIYTNLHGFSGFNICNLRHEFKVIRQ